MLTNRTSLIIFASLILISPNALLAKKSNSCIKLMGDDYNVSSTVEINKHCTRESYMFYESNQSISRAQNLSKSTLKTPKLNIPK